MIKTYEIKSLIRPKGSNAGTYIAKGFSRWYEKHTGLQSGDIIIFEALEPKKKYKMYIKQQIEKQAGR